MAKSRKTATAHNTTDTSKVEARPIGQGKDPLAEGNTLANPTNSEAETHYDVRERSDDVQAKSKIDGQDANQRAEQHNAQYTPSNSELTNGDTSDQDEVAEGRQEPDPLEEQANRQAA